MAATTPANDLATKAQLDFRTFIDVLRQDNDLVEIDCEIDPYLEVGAIVRRVSETNDKAPLFNNVKGAHRGLWRMFGNAASLRSDEKQKYGRLARNLGLPADASWSDISTRFQAGKKSPPLPPNVLPTGPCKGNKIFGDEIDLRRLPAPMLHMEDGGKYLQTYGIHVLRTPDGSWTNWSIFRGMVHDHNHLVALVDPRQHNGIVRQKWKDAGHTEMPWALALGVPPAATMAAAMPIPEGVSEGEYVGAIVGKPLDLVKCELSDLLVPANSEIILEGTTSMTETGYEGPFGDYLGYVFGSDRRLMPLFKVNAITYRNNAILPVSVPGRLTDESPWDPWDFKHTTAALAASEVLEYCKQHGLPIKDAFAPLETYATWCVLQVDTNRLRELQTNSMDFCTRLGNLLFSHKSAMLMNRFLVVGDDINIYEFKDVIWAFVTRCRPGKDEYIFDDVPAMPLTPYMTHGEGNKKRGGKLVSDCLLRMEYSEANSFRCVDFETSYPEHVKTKIQSIWKDLGFSGQ